MARRRVLSSTASRWRAMTHGIFSSPNALAASRTAWPSMTPFSPLTRIGLETPCRAMLALILATWLASCVRSWRPAGRKDLTLKVFETQLRDEIIAPARNGAIADFKERRLSFPPRPRARVDLIFDAMRSRLKFRLWGFARHDIRLRRTVVLPGDTARSKRRSRRSARHTNALASKDEQGRQLVSDKTTSPPWLKSSRPDRRPVSGPNDPMSWQLPSKQRQINTFRPRR